MQFAPVFHAEWLKIRTVRSLPGALLALFAATTAFSAIAGTGGTSDPDLDPLFTALSGVTLGQIAALASAPWPCRRSITTAPCGSRWPRSRGADAGFAAKATAIAVPVLVVSLPTALAALLVARAGLGPAASGLTPAEQIRGVVGCAVHLTLMSLFAAGLATLLRSAVATLSVLIPFLLVVSFVIGDAAGTVVEFMPDRAGQVVLYETHDGTLGPWSGLMVTALWTAAALGAGAWSLRRRDA
ncbi:ABC transporter permease [Streptomyces heliomycini]